ncbi:MAG: glycosyltransferase family A protein, partial [Thermomicrobiales bacterium]
MPDTPPSAAPSPVVSVVMPTYKQARFLPRAVQSLLDQTLTNWELIIVDDGSPDDTQQVVQPYLADPRVRLITFPRNAGLGRALNAGLDAARAELIAYLPSDDVYYPGHLASLAACFTNQPDLALASSGLRHSYNRYAADHAHNEALQLVQTMHRRTPDRWLERAELTTDDLDRMLWNRLRARGAEASTGEITCEWVDHPGQR